MTPWTVAQAALFMGFSKQEYWSGLPVLSPGDLPDLGIEPRSLALQANSLSSEPTYKFHLKKIEPISAYSINSTEDLVRPQNK